jgi:hypothetical protein
MPSRPSARRNLCPDMCTSGVPSNPYRSPASAANYATRPLTLDEIRQMLLGPAIGMAVGAVVCIGIVTLFTVLILMDADFHKEIQGPNQADTIGVYAVFAFFVFMGIAPALVTLFGSWSMLVGRGLVSAWIGAIAGLLNPCCLISGGFAIWGMVILSDPRVSAGMK